MSASKKKLITAVLGCALFATSAGGCGGMAAGQGHSPGDATVVAAAPSR